MKQNEWEKNASNFLPIYHRELSKKWNSFIYFSFFYFFLSAVARWRGKKQHHAIGGCLKKLICEKIIQKFAKFNHFWQLLEFKNFPFKFERHPLGTKNEWKISFLSFICHSTKFHSLTSMSSLQRLYLKIKRNRKSEWEKLSEWERKWLCIISSSAVVKLFHI